MFPRGQLSFYSVELYRMGEGVGISVLRRDFFQKNRAHGGGGGGSLINGGGRIFFLTKKSMYNK